MAQIAAAALVLGSAIVLSWALCRAVRELAPRIGLVDVPGGRKAHARPTPYGGGVAIWATVALIVGVGIMVVDWFGDRLPADLAVHVSGMRAKQGTLLLLLTLATLIMAMGLADDRYKLSWRLRLAIQLGLAIAFVAAGHRVTLFPPFSNPVFCSVVSVLWIVGLTNSFNFLDNMDGLAGGVALIAASLLAVAQVLVLGLFVPAVLLVLVGALAGFLIHNWYPARLFMGDAGSNFLGFFLGGLSLVGTYTRPEGVGSSPYGVLAPLLVMAVPLYDTASVILIRIREGRSPFEGDRRHFSHRLVARGLTPPQAVRTIYLVALSCGLGALLAHRLDALGAGILVVQTLALLGVVAILEGHGPPPTTTRPEPPDGP